jgi:enoyl-CoA hydratase
MQAVSGEAAGKRRLTIDLNVCGMGLMAYENILFEVRDRVAFVTLNRPKVLNALNAELLGELEHCFRQVRDDAGSRAAILTGSGEKAFAAGADINELAQANGTHGKQLAERGQRIFSLIETCGKPVIACVNGFALGGGCELAMACTLRLASENAKFGQPEVKLGIIAGYGGSQRLPRLVGRGRALQMLLTGDMISAAEAHRIGLANEVLPAADLLARGEQVARSMLAVAPLAVSLTMEAVHNGANVGLAEGLAIEAALFGVACSTQDKAEGTRAFLEKRAASWQGK